MSIKAMWYAFRNTQIVKFNSGHYAIRKGWWLFMYKDLSSGLWWSGSSRWMSDCKTKDLQRIGRLYDGFFSKNECGEVIEIDRSYSES